MEILIPIMTIRQGLLKLLPFLTKYSHPNFSWFGETSRILYSYLNDNELLVSAVSIQSEKKDCPSALSLYFFILKKNKNLKLCDQKGPLPLISDLLDHLQKACIFPKLGLREAFNLIQMREHKCLIAFVAQYGNNYVIMPYSFINCLAVYFRFINKIFSDTLGKYVVVYLEDILVFTESPSLTMSGICCSIYTKSNSVLNWKNVYLTFLN